MRQHKGTHATPADLVGTSVRFWMLMAETQSVIAMRTLGMAGLWSVTPTERRRMVDEKLPAFTEAALAAGTAAFHGKRPDQVMDAAIRPLGKATRANSKRLAKRGSGWR